MKGESVKRLELEDMFILDLENEGPTECKAIIVIMEQWKTNQFAQKELGACIQNMYCAICPIGAVAFHFFTCWHLDVECQPSLATSQEWFNIKFAPGRRGLTKEITYNSHLKAVKQCLGSLRMSSAAKTHIGRGSGAWMAELGGASEGDIRRLGRWNSQALAGCS
jgi:Centromere DNA-binding protein complex CBF3 subunit, domain 2